MKARVADLNSSRARLRALSRKSNWAKLRNSKIGNFEAKRDWGHAKDYVRAMHMMLQQPTPDDFVIATGETHSVREFCELAFAEVGFDYRDFVKVDESYYRPAEVDLLIGDAQKAREVLGWEPKYTFRELIKEMVQSDLKANAGT